MEEILGIEVFLTREPGIGGKLKIRPEDFIVEEIPIPLPSVEGGDYTVAKIRARNWEANRMVRQIARTLRISRRRIRFAGTKDKRAVTTQLIQFDCPPEAVKELNIKDVEVLEVLQTDRRIDLGDLLGNRFRIDIGMVELSKSEALNRVSKIVDSIIETGGFPNFFGVQRFGAARPVTHIIGKEICNGDFEGAVMSYLGRPFSNESDEAQEVRRHVENTRDFPEALRRFPRNLSFERAILNHLVKNPHDFVGAIATLPLNLQMMFVHAYQSYLFNRMLSLRLKRGLPLNEPVPGDLILPTRKNGLPDRTRPILVNDENIGKASRKVKDGKAFISGLVFGANPRFAEGEMGDIEMSIIDEEDAKPVDFLVPKIPRISSKGSRREILSPLKSLEFSVGDGSVRTSFELIPGSYATSLLREIMKTDVMSY
ncbi:MAG: tRNA pseudouridine(13) synthase TruD [Thermoplasmata archaeon]